EQARVVRSGKQAAGENSDVLPSKERRRQGVAVINKEVLMRRDPAPLSLSTPRPAAAAPLPLAGAPRAQAPLRILWVKVGGLWPANTGGRLRSYHIISEL